MTWCDEEVAYKDNVIARSAFCVVLKVPSLADVTLQFTSDRKTVCACSI
jgi:hypothetical protein